MENSELLEIVRKKAQVWLGPEYDEETRREVQALLDKDDPTDLIEAFYKDLEFGTGGLRGIMGVGTNRMNIYTVGAATQGLSNYLKKEFEELPQIKVVIGHDCRNNSRRFAEISADIFSANGIKVYLFDALRPTPETSYAIRHLGCQSGIIITASHNPKEYNGYKAYWDDGAQMIAPHDKNTIAEVNKIRNASDIHFHGDKSLIEIIGAEMDERYIRDLTAISLSPDVIRRQHDMKIVYTPIHGTGTHIIPKALQAFGFTNVIHVPEQDVISGDFPTVISPNPEEAAALRLAVEKARETDAELVLASDPDADRVGSAVKNEAGEWVLLNGNQNAILYVYYLLTRWKETGRLTGREYIVKTIVTSETIRAIAERNGVEMYDVYTGFKWIARAPGLGFGYEEAIGFCPDPAHVRDKDGIATSVVAASLVAALKAQGRSVWDELERLARLHGLHVSSPLTFRVEQIEQIAAGMARLRAQPPSVLAGSPVVEVSDLSQGYRGLPPTDGVLVLTEAGDRVIARPSGTEPKLKCYLEVILPVAEGEPLPWEQARERLDAIKGAFAEIIGL